MTAPEHDPSTFHRPAFLALGWSTVGTAVMFGANLVALVVLSRLIDPAAFGVIAIASAIGFIVKMLGVFPLLQATIQANCPNDLRGATNLAWTVAGVSAIVILVVAAPLASVFGIE